MTTVIHCPDCGGVVGATETTDAGPPCRCFANSFPTPAGAGASTSQRRFDKPAAESLGAPIGADDDGVIDSSSATGAAGAAGEVNSGTHVMESPVEPKKVCVRCGKDLAGHRRFKDSYGYWCKDCHRADKQEKELAAPKGVPCDLCFRQVPEDSLTRFEGKQLCSRCIREKREMRKPGSKKFRAISDRAYRQTEIKRLVVMLVILAVLGLIILLRTLGFIGHH